MLTTLSQALRLVGPQRRRRFLVVGLLAVLVSLLEAAGALLVLVLMQLVLEPGEIPNVDLPLLGDVTQLLPFADYRQAVIAFAVVFAVFFVLRAAVFLVQQYALARVSQNTGVLLAHKLMAGYLSMPYEFHLRRNSAELIRNAYDNIQELVGNVFKPMAIVFAEGMVLLVMLAVLILVSPWATLGVAGLMGLTVAGTFAFVQPRLTRLGHQRQGAAKAALQHLQQGLGGLRDIKILHRERPFAQSFRDARLEMAQANIWRVVFAYVPRISIELAFLLFVIVVLLSAVLRDEVDSVLATLGLFAYAGFRLQPSLQKIANGLNSLRYSEAAVQELANDFELVDVSDSRQGNKAGGNPPLPFEDEIRFENVTFQYRQGQIAVKDIDLVIPKGESVGIAGATGGGKTTLLDLLCGLLLPTEGRITVDGNDIAANSRAWQRNIGVVHQSSFLIDATIKQNIAFGILDEQIDERRILQSTAMAELDDVIAGLPDGLDTFVGERGVRLSGGQRQRVTLARALYCQPRLLILDEGTSALDNATESRVIHNLTELPGEVTTVMVAHRLTSIMRCDRIIFLEDGHVGGVGPYEELRDQNPRFRSMTPELQ